MKMNLIQLYLLFININSILSKEYYQLLGIPKNADNREIRKAFKKLALKLHPDKNDADDAHEKFLELTRAYEVLKDEDLRKKYDMFGEEGLDENKGHGGNYQSWNYYHEDFGIYDDDVEIVTLDQAEFQQSVLESHDIWFINFYSPRCGHCHDLAPTWRRLAKQLQGVIRIGAVNCQDEYWICQRQGITGYPTIKLYTMREGTKKYQGNRDEESLIEYVSRFLAENVIDLWSGNLNKWMNNQDARSKPWLIIFCSEQSGCPDALTRKLVGATLHGLVSVGLVDCDQDLSICMKLRGEESTGSLMYFSSDPTTTDGVDIPASIFDHGEISRGVLELLPGSTVLDDDSFSEMQSRLRKEVSPAWVVQFVHGDEGHSLEYKKLVYLIPRQRMGQLDCAIYRSTCANLAVTKFPTFIAFKVGGGIEVNYGKTGVQDIATFARLASQARTMKTLSKEDLAELSAGGKQAFVDFFAPWCPPCMRLLPEFRRASTIIGGDILFGTVDCTVHARLCNEHGISAYPTSIFFNGSIRHIFSGNHNGEAIADFVTDILRPSVTVLNKANFKELVGGKSADEVWLVDFYAPWCGPCRQLAPEWSALGRKLDKLPHVKIGKVDCQTESELCEENVITGYPTIRMYPLESIGSRRYTPYQQYHRDVDNLYQWIMESLPSNVENITPYVFQHSVVRSGKLWLVEFYAPWCGFCVKFAPEYEQVATALRGKANVGKINCEKYKQICKQAGVTGYPTIRIYQGADEDEDYFSQNIESRDPDTIVGVVEEMLIKGKSLGEKTEDYSVDDKRDNEYHEPIYYTDDDEHDDEYDEEHDDEYDDEHDDEYDDEHDDEYDDETIIFRDEL